MTELGRRDRPVDGANGERFARFDASLSAGLTVLELAGMALGQLVREAAEPGAATAGANARFTLMLDATLAHLRDHVGFDAVWGVLNGPDGGDARALLDPAVAEELGGGAPPAEIGWAVAPLLASLAAPTVDGAPPAPLCLTDLEADARAAPLAAGLGLRALLGVPLTSFQSDHVVGALLAGARDPALGSPALLRLVGTAGVQLGTAIDVVATVQRLRGTEERARLVTEQSTDAIYMLDKEGRFTYVNPQVERLTGFAPAELLGRHFSAVVAPVSLPGSLETFRRAEAGEAVPTHHEMEIRRRDGELRTIQANLNPLYEEGRVVGRFGIARDVTERRRLEHELARRNRALEALNAIATLAGRATDLPALLGEALDRSLAVFGMERGAIYLLDEARDELALAARRGVAGEAPPDLARVPAGAGFPARALATAGPVLGLDMAEEAFLRVLADATPAEGLRGYACIALRSQERPLGLLCVAGRDAGPLSPADSETLAIIGAQLGVVIENTRLSAESAAQRASLEAKTGQLSQLLAVSAGFAANVDPPQLLTTVATAICTALGFGSAHVRMHDASGTNLVGVGFYGHTEEQRAALRQPTPDEFYARLMDEQFRISNSYYIPYEVNRARRFGSDWTVVRQQAPPGWRPRPGEWHPEDALVVPLRARAGALIGVIYVDEPRDGRVPDRETIEVLELFARQAAVAIENAGLYTQTRRDLRRQNALREVIEQISAELDLDRLLHTLLASAVELLGAAAGALGLVDEAERVSRIQAVHNMPADYLGALLPAGQGLTGIVLERRQSVLVDDYRQLAHPLELAYHSCLGAPIWERERLVGTLFVGSDDPGHHFGPRDVETLELFAKHAAVAIANAGLYRALQERLSQVEAIGAVGTALIEERDLGRVLRTVGEQLVALLGADGCSIALLDPDEATRRPGEELVLAVTIGHRQHLLQGRRMPLHGSFSGEAIRTGQPVVSEDAQRDPRGFAPALRLGSVQAVLTVPLQTSERTVGALNVHALQDRRFGPHDIAIMTLFAQQAAVAIENARLYEQGRELAVAEERNRLAREIHDTLAQGFTGIILQLELAQSLLEGDAAAAGGRLRRAQALARLSLQEARRSVWNLRPSPLQGRSLDEALRVYLDEWSETTGIPAAYTVEGTPRPLSAEVENTLFRIAQEALHNTYKHADARRVEVTLAIAPATLRLSVCDDGGGFAGARHHDDGGGFGLVSMRERAGRVGGRLAIESTPGRGTCVHVSVGAADDDAP